MEYTIITIILPALVAAAGITSAILIALHPRKYFFAETVESILESDYEIN
mgnify:CR=1 FL=1